MNDSVENKIEETTALDNISENNTEETTVTANSTENNAEEVTKTDTVKEDTSLNIEQEDEQIQPRVINGQEESSMEGESLSSGETASLTETAPTTSNMSMPFIGLSAIQCIVAFLLIAVVLQQSKSASGITSSAIVGGDSQSYWNQNKGRSQESKLARMTVILGVIFFIVTISLGFVK